MGRNYIAIIAIFLVQGTAALQGALAESSSLNPPTKVNLNSQDIGFIDKYSIVHQAVYLYKIDAIGKAHRQEIIADYNTWTTSDTCAIFNVYNIEKDGWTRYYPVTVSDHVLTVRVFLTSKRDCQAEVQVLYEGSIENPPVTFQVLPGVNDIIKDRQMKPHRPNYNAIAAVGSSS